MSSTKTKDPENLTSSECAERIAELEARRNEIAPRLADLRPPNIPRGAPADAGAGGWTPPDVLAGAGPEFSRVVLEGSPAELIAMDAEREELSAELWQIEFREDRLRSRMQVAEEEEKRAAAPRVAEDAVAALDDALAARVAAFYARKVAEDRVAELVSVLRGARSLAGTDAAAMTPEQLRELWAYPPGRKLQVIRRNEVTGMSGVGAEFVRDARELLGPPERGILDRMRERLRGSHVNEKDLVADLAAHRARLIASGDFAGLEAAEGVALRSGAGKRE